MHKKYLFLFLALFFALPPALHAQDEPVKEKYQLKGLLLDAESSEAISFAHVTNLQKGLRTLSDSSGFFRIPVSEGDSLEISSVSYGRQKIVVPAEPGNGGRLLIQLLPNTYELEEVVVSSLPSERRFKQQLLTMELPEEKNKVNRNFPEYQPQAKTDGSAAVGLGNPVSAVAGMFSKKQRGREFAATIEAKEERRAIIHTKYNREVVKKITGLEDEEEVDAFMQYCKLNEEFIYDSNEYEIHDAVLGCFKSFQSEKKG